MLLLPKSLKQAEASYLYSLFKTYIEIGGILVITTASYTYTGADQFFTVPAGVTTVNIKAWGAGSGGAPGGYASGDLLVTPGDSLTIIVGQAGILDSIVGTYGGGGAGGTGRMVEFFPPPDGIINGCSGGGRSAVIRNTTEVLTAGGAGGIESKIYSEVFPRFTPVNYPGSGGCLQGTNGFVNPTYLVAAPGLVATGGTQVSGGVGGTPPNTTTIATGQNGSSLQGGDGGSYFGSVFLATAGAGGGGGGGYFGGGGGSGMYYMYRGHLKQPAAVAVAPAILAA